MSELQIKVYQIYGADWLESRAVLVEGALGWEFRKHSRRMNERGEWYTVVGPWLPPGVLVRFDPPAPRTGFRRRLAAMFRALASLLEPEGCRG